MRIIRERFPVFLALLGVCLALAVPLALTGYANETWPVGARVAAAGLASTAVAIALIGVYTGTRWVYARRRLPLVWIAIRVLRAASRKTSPSISARGISDSDGNLAVSLPRRQNDFLAADDSFLATNAYTGEHLGLVEVVLVEPDFCLCLVTDRMDSQNFWAGLENRMAHDFSPPSGVEFSRCINQNTIDFAKRIIRGWGG